MEYLNFYISINEAELLIFDRALVVSSSRLELKRSQNIYGISIKVDQERVIEIGNQYLILFSSILIFDIPEKDLNLFQHHYKVPRGLIHLGRRVVKDKTVNELTLKDYPQYNFADYQKIRSGLIGIIALRYKYMSLKKLQTVSEQTLNSFYELSDFQCNFIREITKGKTFPILEVNVDKFIASNFFRITWWGKYIVDNYLSDCDEDTRLSIRKWLRVFLDGDNFKDINTTLANIPKELKGHINFLMGYYFAAYHFETLLAEEEFQIEIYTALKYEERNEIFCWLAFFKSLFNVTSRYIYFIPKLTNNLFQIEQLAFNLANHTSVPLKINKINFLLDSLDKEQLISNYLSVVVGAIKDAPNLLSIDEARSIFENNFSPGKTKNLGFGLEPIDIKGSDITNICWYSSNAFNLQVGLHMKPSEVVFFLDEHSKVRQIVKDLKIKVKPTENLIGKDKKVILSFIKESVSPSLYVIYSKLLKKTISDKIEKIVFVMLVNMTNEEIQSIQFDNYIKNQHRELSKYFDNTIEIVVKNERVDNDVEIKRNLKNALRNYKMKEIEVIDQNFNYKKAAWLLEVNTEYFIYDDQAQYYYV